MDFSFEGIYARGASGQLYNYDCRPGCAWTTREALPALPGPEEGWFGKCYAGAWERSGLGLTPPPPRRAVMVLPTKFCGWENSFMTYYLLTDDGALWRWGWMDLGYAMFPLVFCAYPFFFLLGSALALAWTSRYG